MKSKFKLINSQRQKFVFLQKTKEVLSMVVLMSLPLLIGNIMKTHRSSAIINNAIQDTKSLTNLPPTPIESPSIPKTEIEDSASHQNHTSAVYRVGYVDLTNTGILYVSSSTILASEGNIVTSATGNTENNGDVYVKGDWINNGTYTKDNGKVTFWDTDNQVIDGTSAIDIYNVEVNKASGNVALNVNATVSNVLTLTSGMVNLNSKTLTISSPLTTAIAYTSGYLKSEQTNNSSKVQWNIGSTTGAHIIPFGTAAGTLIPLTLNLTAGTIGNVTASTYPTAANNTPYPVTPDSVLHLRDNLFNDNSANVVDRFWQINRSGAAGTLTITFTYTTAEEPATGDATLVSQLYTTAYKAWYAPFPSQTNNAATNIVTTPGITLFGPFTLVKSESTLPIQLLSFNATLNNDRQVDLDWETASEINNSYFTIQRSTNLNDVEEIENIPGAGNSSEKSTYHTVDRKPYLGDSYYRLKQTDYDGKFTLGEWKHVKLSNKEFKEDLTVENIFPNPFYDEFQVDYTVIESGEVAIQLVNDIGQLIFSDKATAAEGKNSYLFSNRNGLSSGMYYFNILYKGRVKSFKVVKKN